MSAIEARRFGTIRGRAGEGYTAGSHSPVRLFQVAFARLSGVARGSGPPATMLRAPTTGAGLALLLPA